MLKKNENIHNENITKLFFNLMILNFKHRNIKKLVNLMKYK